MDSNKLQRLKSEIEEISRSCGLEIEKAFIRWYVENFFGQNAHYDITDSTGDGGIDAIVYQSNSSITLIQSKYSEGFFNSNVETLSAGFYNEFDNLIRTFKRPNDFEIWIRDVNRSAANKYRIVFNKYQRKKIDLNWRFISTMSPSPSSENRLKYAKKDFFTYSNGIVYLNELSIEDTPPSTDFILRFKNAFTYVDEEFSLNTYILVAKLIDFLKYMEEDSEDRFFAKNVRNDLHTDINDDIVQTFKDAPNEFWYSNNGIHIICTSATVRGEQITLKYPYVINGSQTLHSIKNKTSKRPENCWVLARIFEIPEDIAIQKKYKELIDNIVLRTNQQNKIFKFDLRANDNIQIQLAKNFSNYKIFYERRRGDWDAKKVDFKKDGFISLKSTTMAKINAACDPDYGPSHTRLSVENLFSDKNYYKIFKIDDNPEIPIAKVKLLVFIENVLYHYKKEFTDWGSRRYFIFPILTIFWQGIDNIKNIPTINLLTNLNYKDNVFEPLTESIKNVLDISWKMWQKLNKTDSTVSIANFVKSKDFMTKTTDLFNDTKHYSKIKNIIKIIEMNQNKKIDEKTQ